MNNIDGVLKQLYKYMKICFEENEAKSFKIAEDLRKAQLKLFSTKELMDELRRRWKTVSKKGIR